jgi:glycosyltransferase involved in cell wall biosynthesis
MRKNRFEILWAGALLLADLLALNALMVTVLVLYFGRDLFSNGAQGRFWQTSLAFLGMSQVFLLGCMALMGGYRSPRRWRLHEAMPLTLRVLACLIPLTSTGLFLLRLGIQTHKQAILPSRMVVLLWWLGVGICLTGLRVLMGRLKVAIHRRGIGLRRCLVVGDDVSAERLLTRLAEETWVGEFPVGRVGWEGEARLGTPAELDKIIQQYHIDVIWCVPSTTRPLLEAVPPLLFEPDGAGLIWHMLPEHFDMLSEQAMRTLSYEQREILYRRVDHRLDLPIFRLAMIGSRGVPASYSGIETYVEEVGAFLAQSGVQVAVYCHARYVTRRGRYRGMELRFVPTIPSKHLETIIHTLLASLHVLFCDDEIIHYHAIGPSTLAWLPRLLGRKVVVSVQGIDWQRAKWGWLARKYLQFGEWASAEFPHELIVVSQALLQYYQQKYRRPIRYIPNGFTNLPPADVASLSSWDLCPDDYVLFVGRLTPEKGCHTLIRAFKQLSTEKKLVLAGKATYLDDYQRQLEAEAQDFPAIRFLGFVPHHLLGQLYRNATLFVHPSELEGMSIALLEALSYSCCVVVSDRPENLEVIQENGYSFPTGDSAALACRLQYLLDHPASVQEMRLKACQAAMHLADWSVVADSTLPIYRALLL